MKPLNKELNRQTIERSIESKTDRIANKVREQIGCDKVLISIILDETLLAIGIAATPGLPEMPRTHNKADTVCAETIARGELLVCTDVRLDRELADIPYVKERFVAGYLGCPVRDSEDKSYGAICALTSEPREWSDSDIAAIRAGACEAASLIAVEQIRNELSGIQKYLADADRALMSLANSMTALVSVHDTSGELLFASSNLRLAFNETTLEDAVREALQTDLVDRQLSQFNRRSDDRVARLQNVVIRNHHGSNTAISAQIRPAATDTYYVYWKPEQNYLN